MRSFLKIFVWPDQQFGRQRSDTKREETLKIVKDQVDHDQKDLLLLSKPSGKKKLPESQEVIEKNGKGDKNECQNHGTSRP